MPLLRALRLRGGFILAAPEATTRTLGELTMKSDAGMPIAALCFALASLILPAASSAAPLPEELSITVGPMKMRLTKRRDATPRRALPVRVRGVEVGGG